ncbi:MAG: hypothetical protein KKE11_00175 [Gammaproteobacteria bacterium]|nr:hypothetical protein [Gammaproteobacteria bacterium]
MENSNVLLDYGVTYLINAGYKVVPLDRGDAYIELFNSGKDDLVQIDSRIGNKKYDKLYFTTDNYPLKFFDLMKDKYQIVDVVKPPPLFNFWSGYQIKPSCVILEAI